MGGVAKRPESVLRELLGDAVTKVTFLGREVDAVAEVAIPDGCDIHELLSDHAERVAMWGKAQSKCHNRLQKLRDELDELRGMRFVQYWQAYESQERKEMAAHLHDEDEVDQDRGDPIRRSQRAKRRVRSGLDAGRWRRNFSDDLINANVSSDPKVVEMKRELRKAKNELEQVTAVMEAMRHRQTALNHLAALYRDTARQ